MKEDRAIIFTHIPKCAGTSFRESIININISEEYVYTSHNFFSFFKYKKDFQYIIGHWPFGIEKYVHPLNPVRRRKKILVTFLRNPIDHLVSFYFFQKQQGKYSNYAEDIKGKNIVEFYKTTPKALNLQTRFCAGVFYEQFFKRTIQKYKGTHFQLKVAKKNLIQNFDFVGQLENIANDMSYFCHNYNLKFEYKYAEITRTKKRPKTHDLSPETIKILSELNNLDIELYSFAKEQLFFKRKSPV